MKKAGMNAEKDNDTLVLIIIGVIVVGFIFGMKPIYQFVGRIKDGSLFEKDNKPSSQVTPEVKEEEKEEKYVLLTPAGDLVKSCSKNIEDEGGTEYITVDLYYTGTLLKSINAKYKYSGLTDEYANYILSEQNKYNQRRTANISDKGYSIEVDLVSFDSLRVNEVILLEKTLLNTIELGADTKDLSGDYNKNIDEVVSEYVTMGYVCK